jgi:DNA-binding transcriptional ArsR family regulator
MAVVFVFPLDSAHGQELEVRRKMATTDYSIKNIPPETKTAARKKSAKGADLRLKQAQRASILLKHVSDPTRLQVILILSEGEQHVGSLCEILGQSQPAVSHHLALMRHGGVIAPRRQGKNNFYSLTDKGDDLSKVVKSLMA